MYGIFKYSHLSTKIRAMTGKMLKQSDYEELLSKRSVKDAAIYLKNNTYYRDVLGELNENDVHRGHLENLLYQSLIYDALKISRYLKGSERTVYRFVYRRQEIEDLKKMMRTLQVGKSLEHMDKRLFFINKYSVIDFNILLKADNFNTWIQGLKNTNFYKILSPLVINDHTIDLFSAEMALDMYYYKRLINHLSHMSRGKNRKIVEFYLGAEADLKNILWIYRGKRYYNLNKEMLYRYLIPHNYKLKSDTINQLIDAKDEEAILSLLDQSPYKALFNNLQNEWEKHIQEYLVDGFEKFIRLNPFSIAPIVGYIVIKEIEIANITTIIEGIRYGEDSNTLKRFLINI